ncbi:MAG: type VI secretion system protein TssA [Syntrophobacteraceae bacterium]|nr:type VI secretion system protein TssA [Syntrophobacteraceae bacterium]
MSILRLENLLREISPGHPSGERSLDHDPDFWELEKEIAGTPAVEVEGKLVQEARAPNWSHCAETAVDLLDKAHDLRVAVYLTRALLHSEGLEGLRDGLSLICGYLERYWETLYPGLDPEEDNDPTERVNVLEALNDWQMMIAPLLKLQLCFSRTAGSVSLRQYLIASGKTAQLSLTADELTTAPNLAAIEAAFADASPEALNATSRAASESVAAARRLESGMNGQVGSERAPDLKNLIQILKEIDNLMKAHLFSSTPFVKTPEEDSKDKSSDTGDDYAQNGIPTRVRSFDTIESREDVIELLEQICAYYELFEPASPVPLLLKRAIGLVTKNFLEIIKDLAPDSMPQVAVLFGTKDVK